MSRLTTPVIRALALAMMALLTAACVGGRAYHVSVNGLGEASPSSFATFVVIPGQEGVAADDLLFREFSAQVGRALAQRGFQQAETPDSADLAIALSYGISDPKTEQYSYTVPRFGVTGYQSSHTTGVVSSFGNTALYSGTTTYTPRYGVTGNTTHSGTRTYFVRYVVLSGYDFRAYRAANDVKEICRTVITSAGASGDLRASVPVLLAAAVPYLGRNTGKIVTVSIRPGDKRMAAIRRSNPTK